MKKYIRTITWKFADASHQYPELKDKNVRIQSPQDLYEAFKFLFLGEVKERFVVFWLSSSNNVTGFEVISEGLLNSCQVHPREVFRGAIISSAAGILVAHNYPSGNTDPSNEDIAITKKLVDAGKIIDISLFDHLIFTDDGYTSFVDRKLM